MAHIKLLFLPSKTPSTRKSKHEEELEVQQARAHAASIAHHRAGRKGASTSNRPKSGEQRGQHPSQSSAVAGPLPSYSRWLLPVVVDKPGTAPEQDDRQPQQRTSKAQQSQGLAWIKTGPLDPFFQLPADLDIKERNLLFYCESWSFPFPLSA
ncbi:hypothetical protein CLCR_10957 [Cladophialophora carrionii]|uniref:Uncharacterized protein n=1 Tax=Cladophialophora carrionii TaxID=86049 RepID=A0A1C1CW30_9EURO|nr:hypothetical protein CLCR_10957 [Cladophialophora carrionii]